MHMPDIWGEGQILAFSGLDGPTDVSRPFVLHTGQAPGSLKVRLPFAADVDFEPRGKLDFSLTLGDVITADSAQGPWTAVFRDRDTLVGQMPAGRRMTINGVAAGETGIAAHSSDGKWTLHAFTRGNRWSLCLGAPGGDPFAADIAALVHDRSAFVRSVAAPPGHTPARERLLRKAVSVMKANCHAPCGSVRRRWTTPDRWPHEHLWLWDSAFHGLGLSYVDLGMAQDAVLAMLEQIGDDGMLPHMINVAKGERSRITQPPILGWATLQILERSGDRDWAAQCLPFLLRQIDWDRANRDRNNNGIPEWYIEGDPRCRCGESGQDNSSVYDGARLLDAPDFGSFLANDYNCAAAMAERLGDRATAQRCHAEARRIGNAVRDQLWWEKERFFFHRDFEGSFVPVKAVSGFMPLFAGIATPEQAGALRNHLSNPDTFGAAMPVPSESLDSGRFCKDMWRGPAWLNMSYMVYLGLKRYGYAQDAAALKERLLAGTQQWYEQEGCLWEFYDALNFTSPRDLDRKQRLSRGQGMAPISDYHWSAAVTAGLLME